MGKKNEDNRSRRKGWTTTSGVTLNEQTEKEQADGCGEEDCQPVSAVWICIAVGAAVTILGVIVPTSIGGSRKELRKGLRFNLWILVSHTHPLLTPAVAVGTSRTGLSDLEWGVGVIMGPVG